MTPQRKRVLYILFFAFVMSEGMFRVLVYLITQQARQAPPVDALATMRPICYAMAGVTLLASIGWTLVRTRASPTWQQFQTNIILGLALSEACTIFGMLLFLLGALPNEFNGFAIASVVVDLVVILPQIIRRTS